MPIIPPNTAVESDHSLTGILKILKMAIQIRKTPSPVQVGRPSPKSTETATVRVG
jgi:hypothetical protein